MLFTFLCSVMLSWVNFYEKCFFLLQEIEQKKTAKKSQQISPRGLYFIGQRIMVLCTLQRLESKFEFQICSMFFAPKRQTVIARNV